MEETHNRLMGKVREEQGYMSRWSDAVKGMSHFVEVGTALLMIRGEKLYKDLFRTFEEYCKERWGFSVRQAERFMVSATTVKNLETRPIGRIPTSEYQTRPLTSLEPEQQKEVWDQAVKTAPKRITSPPPWGGPFCGNGAHIDNPF